MHVDIHPVGRNVDVEHIDGLAVAMQDVFVGAAGGVCDDLIAHKTAVHIGELLIRSCPSVIGQARSPTHSQANVASGDLKVNGHTLRFEVVAQNISHALECGCVVIGCKVTGGRRAPLLNQFAVMPNRKSDPRPSQCMAPHSLDAVGELGCVSFQEFASSRCGEKQFMNRYGRADLARAGAQFTGPAVQQPRVGVL